MEFRQAKMYKISNMAAPMSHVITCIRNIEGPSVDGAFDEDIFICLHVYVTYLMAFMKKRQRFAIGTFVGGHQTKGLL